MEWERWRKRVDRELRRLRRRVETLEKERDEQAEHVAAKARAELAKGR